MKIISGRFKGRIICMPKDIRSTANKAREALFEILKDRIEEASFLDLYCGSGAIGIEAFSRGAKKVVFVDNSFRCITILKENLRQLGIITRPLTHPSPLRGEGEGVNIYKNDVLKVLKEFQKSREIFDIIFIDPPYYKDMAKNALIELSDYDILAKNAIIAVESYKKDFLPEKIGVLTKTRRCQYGDTKLEFFKIA